MADWLDVVTHEKRRKEQKFEEAWDEVSAFCRYWSEDIDQVFQETIGYIHTKIFRGHTSEVAYTPGSLNDRGFRNSWSITTGRSKHTVISLRIWAVSHRSVDGEGYHAQVEYQSLLRDYKSTLIAPKEFTIEHLKACIVESMREIVSNPSSLTWIET